MNFVAEAVEAGEFFDGAAVVALGLGLVAEEEGPTVGVSGHALEAVGEGVVADLVALDLGVGEEGGIEGNERSDIVVVEGVVEGVGEHTGFEAGGADEGELGDGDALGGEQFLGVGGLVGGYGGGAQALERLVVFDAEDGDEGGGEAVGAGVLSGAGLALGGAGSGGAGRVGSIGSELFRGNGLHCRFRYSTGVGWSLKFIFVSG